MASALAELREHMNTHGLDAYLQPVHDAYMSEYPPEANQRVAFLTGFLGSAGTVAVLQEKAALFTDGRYTLQAAGQIDGNLYEVIDSGVTTPEAWLEQQLQSGQVVGYDANLYSAAALRRLSAALDKKQVVLKPVGNLVDAVWPERPAAPASPLYAHDVAYSGQDAKEKRASIVQKIREAGAHALVLASPESVCWLLNIRASDVENTPVALAYALVTVDGHVKLYVDEARVDAKTKAHLGVDVKLRAPEKLEQDLQEFKSRVVMLDPASASVWFSQVLRAAEATILEAPDPCVLPKACKNEVELKGIRAAHLRDGVAVTKLLYWVDTQAPIGQVTEMEIAERLLELRKQQALFSEPSFPTIAGSGPNGAIVHYRATKQSNRALQNGELLLLDSGGQYHDGTTDVTRTLPIGTPSDEHIDRNTRVLKGHIAIALARFPDGTAGSQLDSLARQYLWEIGLDYEHGTGHGVGQFLGVHEGPQRISKRGGDCKLMPGMVISNEPGYYQNGGYGIRIENLVVVVEKSGGKKPYFGFETLTCVPIDTRLVNAAMLSEAEKAWLNTYHAWVHQQLKPSLSEAEQAWLAERCNALI